MPARVETMLRSNGMLAFCRHAHAAPDDLSCGSKMRSEIREWHDRPGMGLKPGMESLPKSRIRTCSMPEQEMARQGGWREHRLAVAWQIGGQPYSTTMRADHVVCPMRIQVCKEAIRSPHSGSDLAGAPPGQ